ncbi:MAG: ATP-dependent RecD-like DNA helicase [Planctomycetota bacterium]
MGDTPPLPEETIEGVLNHIVYQSEKTGYTVARLKKMGEPGSTCIVGNLSMVTAGETLRCKGEWTNHPRFGRQFKVNGFEILTPGTRQGMIRYLSSGMIKGIGPKLAEALVDEFGHDTLQVIDENPNRLLGVPGIGEARLSEILKSWDSQKGMREILVFLQGYGLGPSHAARVYKEYGNAAIRLVKENPYRLSDEIFGIGFKTADRIAINLGVQESSPFRIRATLTFLLNQASGEGHMCLPFQVLVQRASEYLGLDMLLIEAQLEILCAEGRLAMKKTKSVIPFDGGSEPYDCMIFTRHLHDAEEAVHRFMMRLKAHAKWSVPLDIPKAIDWAEQEAGFKLETSQREAVAAALSEPVLVITGGPGVGKTTIVRCIARILSQKNFDLALAAPTGRAAKRLMEATGYAASTIHRLLRFNPHSFEFEHNEETPLSCNVLIVDEASMIDVPLMEKLVRALKPLSRLILVGDVDQLPSVGPGELLRSLIDCGVFTVVRLTKLFRQEEGGGITTAAHSVNRGELPEFTEPGRHGEIFYINQPEGEEAAQQVVKLVTERIPERFGLDPFKDIQVLTPMHKGSAGTENLNRLLQAKLNPEGEEMSRFGRTFREGDKVMQIKNNYNLNVFNGDIGTVRKINHEKACMQVLIDNEPVEYPFDALDELTHAYCISIHKSQGSEFPAVVMPLLTQHYILLRRNLLYTGITRARRLLVIVGAERALSIALSNTQTRTRFTLLDDRFREE